MAKVNSMSRKLTAPQCLFETTSNTTAVDVRKLAVRTRVAGNGTAVRGIDACDAIATMTTRTRQSERRAIGGGIAVGESPAH